MMEWKLRCWRGDNMDEKLILYQQILHATRNGNDAEVRKDKNGNFIVYSVKKQRADKLNK